jgi:hypothetical protein
MWQGLKQTQWPTQLLFQSLIFLSCLKSQYFWSLTTDKRESDHVLAATCPRTAIVFILAGQMGPSLHISWKHISLIVGHSVSEYCYHLARLDLRAF